MNLIISILVAISGVATGWASQYESHWIMDETVKLRQEWGQLPANLEAWDGFVAAEDCDLVGETAFIRIVELRPLRKDSLKSHYRWQWHPYLIADCSGHASTTNWMRRDHILIEFGRREAERLGIADRGGVKIEMIVIE